MQDSTHLILAPSVLKAKGELPEIDALHDAPTTSRILGIINELPVPPSFKEGDDEHSLSPFDKAQTLLLGESSASREGIWGRLRRNVERLMNSEHFGWCWPNVEEVKKESLKQAAHAQLILTSLLGMVPEDKCASQPEVELVQAWNKMASALDQAFDRDVTQDRLDVALNILIHGYAPINIDTVNTQRQQRAQLVLC